MTTKGTPSFREQIASTHHLLLQIAGKESENQISDGGWSRKEILGHLIDSALNNHQRFVRASLDGSYDGPSYKQKEWVDIHGYQSIAWEVLVEHWRLQNELLSNVVERIPENHLEAMCRVGNDAPVTLEFLIEDYLNHLNHHVRQIVPSLG